MKKWIQHIFYNWSLIRLVARQSAEEAEEKLYTDLSNRMPLDELIEELIKIKNEKDKYISVARIIEIQSRRINK